MKKINLATLSRDELMDLNSRIITELKYRTEVLAKGFSIGDKVSFKTRQGQTVTGVVKRRNARTVSVYVKEGVARGNWRVTASLLSRA